MRRVGAVLLSIAATLVVVPVPAGAAPAATAVCRSTVLPMPDSGYGYVEAIVEPGVYVGTGSTSSAGTLWRNGTIEPLAISPRAANASGLIVGTATDSSRRAARMRLGGAVEVGYNSSSGMVDVNASGHAVGFWYHPWWPPFTISEPLWWRSGDATATVLPPGAGVAWDIDDLGYMVGEAPSESGKQWLVWGPDGTVVRQFGPYAEGEPSILPRDVDDGVLLATRYTATGAQDIILIDIVTGAVTPVPGTSEYGAELIDDGWVVGKRPDDDGSGYTYAAWHDGVRHDLPSPPDSWIWKTSDLKVYGTTALVVGASRSTVNRPPTDIPMVWECG